MQVPTFQDGRMRIDGILAVKFVKWLRRLFGELEYP